MYLGTCSCAPQNETCSLISSCPIWSGRNSPALIDTLIMLGASLFINLLHALLLVVLMYLTASVNLTANVVGEFRATENLLAR